MYGFKVRGDFENKSGRTYDNERRRIESLLAGYTQSEYTAKGKKVYINVDSKTIPENPLYTAWKSKSFTDNDLMLHFLLPELLLAADHEKEDSNRQTGLTSGEAAELLSLRYSMIYDSQTIRLKLKEYEALGVLTSYKEGRTLRYRAVSPLPMESRDAPEQLWTHLLAAVTFFQGTAPFGILGSTILDREDQKNRFFQFKHHFIVHTLEDGVLLNVLEAIRQGREIAFDNKSRRTGRSSCTRGIPLQIFVSTRTGRRYLCLYLPVRRRFHNMRLDSMSDVTLLEPAEDYLWLREKLRQNLPSCFGVSFGGSSRMEEIHIRLLIDEEREAYVLDRLTREGRGGEIMRIRKNEYLYSGRFYDTNEMLSWVKSFTGRILDIQGSNQFCIDKVTCDWEKMYQLYCKQKQDTERPMERQHDGAI